MTRTHRQTVLLAVAISLASALFFTSTYVLNRAAATGGGHWLWTAALRYLLTLPMLWPLMRWQGGSAPVWRAIRRHPGACRCRRFRCVAADAATDRCVHRLSRHWTRNRQRT